MPAEAGIKFGSFILLRRIARGGMAEVFLAQQRGLEGFDRRVAVKRILPHLADSRDFVRMFLGEAKLAAQLSHPNIVHIYEFGKVAGDFFIAMEYVEGVHAGELFQASGAGSRLSPTLVARIGADAASALHSAHELRGADGKSLGLVHRDVSPANLMISYDGIVKLCDFGIAKAAAVTDQLTSPGQVKGKYAYMSPEQTVAQPLDGRSDVFSLSIVLWELLTGTLIVPRGDAVAAMRMIRDGKIEPLAAVAPHVPPALAQAIAWGLETRREDRATASELAQALEAFIKQSPEIATPMQLGNWVRTHLPRERISEHPAHAPGAGTQVASSGTDASSSANLAVTPHPDRERDRDRDKALIGASLLAREDEHADGSLGDSSETRVINKPSRPGFQGPTPKPFSAPTAATMIAPLAARDSQPKAENTATLAITNEPFDLSDGATTIDKPFTPLSNPSVSGVTPRPVNQADAPTQIATPMRGIPAEVEHSDATATVLLDRAPVPLGPLGPPGPPGPPGPGSGRKIVPADFLTPLSGPRVRVSEPLPPSGAMQPLPSPGPFSAFLTPWRVRAPRHGGTPRAQSKQMRVAITIAALVGLALVSFVVALAASGHHAKDAAARKDAAATVVMQELGANPGSAVIGARTVGVDAGAAPAIDAGRAPREAYLEIATSPPGGMVKVGGQVRIAPARVVVDAGTFEVTGDLTGYQPETRRVTVEPGAHLAVALTFDHKLVTSAHPAAPTGRLTAKTTPASEVFENGKKLGDTPFADREMTAGPHVLVFKNPLHPPLTRRVLITAGKVTKLAEKLSD